MTTPTEQRIEAAAKAIWEVSHPNPPGWAAWGDRDGFGPSNVERALTLKQARAALTADAPSFLTAVSPSIRNKALDDAAKCAETEVEWKDLWDGQPIWFAVAAAIRRLKLSLPQEEYRCPACGTLIPCPQCGGPEE